MCSAVKSTAQSHAPPIHAWTFACTLYSRHSSQRDSDALSLKQRSTELARGHACDDGCSQNALERWMYRDLLFENELVTTPYLREMGPQLHPRPKELVTTPCYAFSIVQFAHAPASSHACSTYANGPSATT